MKNLKTIAEIDQMDYQTLRSYDEHLNQFRFPFYDKERELKAKYPHPKSLQDLSHEEVTAMSASARASYKENYRLKKQLREADIKKSLDELQTIHYDTIGTEKSYFDYVRVRLNEMYRTLPHEVKFKTELALLQEAQAQVTSAKQRADIQALISHINRNGMGFLVNEFDTAWYLGARAAVIKLIRQLGGKKYYQSDTTAKGSVYYELPNSDCIRISDHELPDTDRREHNRSRGWSANWIDLVLGEPKPMTELKIEVLEYLQEYAGKNDLVEVFAKENDKLFTQIMHLLTELAFSQK